MQTRHCFGFVLAIVLVFAVSTHAQSPREQLNQMVQEFATIPIGSGRDALRERIIKLAAGITPAPAVPPEAERFEDRARYMFEHANSEVELLDAASEYLKASNAAPWIADYYFNRCMILEKANKPARAIVSCKWYLVAAPDAPDAREVRKRIAGLDYVLERRRESFSRRNKEVYCSESDRYEIGAKVANVGDRKISVKLISVMYDGTPRNQVLITNITTSDFHSRRWNLDPIYETGFHLDETARSTSPLYDLSINRDGSITVWRNRQAVIVTSIDELTQLRNDQMNTSPLLTQGDKTFVTLCQGGPLRGNDGALATGLLLFPSECSGKLMSAKPGWLPAMLIEPRTRNGSYYLPLDDFSTPNPDSCDR